METVREEFEDLDGNLDKSLLEPEDIVSNVYGDRLSLNGTIVGLPFGFSIKSANRLLNSFFPIAFSIANF